MHGLRRLVARRTIQAFTLIELALALLVVSLMVGLGMQAFQSNTSLTCYDKTEAQLKVIDRALQNFVDSNSRLPKPAFMGYGSNNAQFGYEATGGVATDHIDYATTVPAGMTSQSGALIGALPHATLGLAVENAADCWGNKFTYAVSNALTSSNATNGYPGSGAGAITLNSNTLGSPTLLSSSTSYVVVSHGPDKAGATPISASDITPRSCSVSGTKIDSENCDTGNAVFFSASRNTGTNAANYFDDIVVFSTRSINCAADPAISWLIHCSGAVGALTHGASITIPNTAGGYTGNATVSCSDGTLSTSDEVCEVDDGTTCCYTGEVQGAAWMYGGGDACTPAPNGPFCLNEAGTGYYGVCGPCP